MGIRNNDEKRVSLGGNQGCMYCRQIYVSNATGMANEYVNYIEEENIKQV